MNNYSFNYTILRNDYKEEVLMEYKKELKKVETAISIWTEVVEVLKSEKNHDKKLTKRELNKIESNCSYKIRLHITKDYSYRLHFNTLNDKGYNDGQFDYEDKQNDVIHYENNQSVGFMIDCIESKIDKLHDRKNEIKVNVEKISSSDLIKLHNEKMKEIDRLIKEANELKKLLKVKY